MYSAEPSPCKVSEGLSIRAKIDFRPSHYQTLTLLFFSAFVHEDVATSNCLGRTCPHVFLALLIWVWRRERCEACFEVRHAVHGSRMFDTALFERNWKFSLEMSVCLKKGHSKGE